MFGRLATVRLKTAEDALVAGRLDEAFETVSSRDLSSHERAVRIRQSLAAAFFDRGQERLLSRQFAAAITDFDRAAACGHAPEKVKEWRARAEAAFEADRQAALARQNALHEARRRVEAGSLDGAAEALRHTPHDDPAVGALAQSIERQHRLAADAMEAAQTAIARDDLATAAQQFCTARRLHHRLEGLTQMEMQLTARAGERAQERFDAGRLDRARQDLDVLVSLDCRSAARTELEDLMRHAADAQQALAQHDYARASLNLGWLLNKRPQSQWIADARRHLAAIEAAMDAVLEGPLGILGHAQAAAAPGSAPTGHETIAAPRSIPPRVATPSPAVPPVPGLPRRILLRVDGVGSFLMVRGDRISIGRAGVGASADVQLVSDLAERQAEIVRSGEDYFVVSQSGVELAGSNVDHALLQDGDRVRLGKRIRLKFRRPSLKSNAAVLELSDGVRMENDCRRVLLWSGPILIGGLRECHIVAPGISSEFVLIERGGQMSIKSMGARGEAIPIELGSAMTVGDLRFTATPVVSHGPGLVTG